jgi:hypothetical protein
LERQGVVPHSHADVLAQATFGMDRADAVTVAAGRFAAVGVSTETRASADVIA